MTLSKGFIQTMNFQTKSTHTHVLFVCFLYKGAQKEKRSEFGTVTEVHSAGPHQTVFSVEPHQMSSV